MNFKLHHLGPCELCMGTVLDSDFDYCRACGFTVLAFAPMPEPIVVGSPTFAETIKRAAPSPMLPALQNGFA